MLGAGLVDVPPVPYRDPTSAVLADPVVPEHKRFCGGCGRPVGRGGDDAPGRTEGFCHRCGHRFSFTPMLRPGQLVGGQYEVLGCLAHGGLGWVYLARDRFVNDRWVVLKGLLNTDDAEAMAAAEAERGYLAEVEHPNIVRIYNFVQHHDVRTATAAGYIVMEYVGGRSLKGILRERREAEGADAALPLPQVLAYGLEVLNAMGHLHARGLLYCDFKPDNAVQSKEQLKLIDLGGVRRMDDATTPVYGTVGYQASEISDDGPSVSSDLYTVARTLAVLSFPFRGYTTTYSTTLPPRAKVPLLRAYESFDRLLRRATHANPKRRFTDAGEMSEQLTGVLREVLALRDGRARPARSGLFGPEQHAVGTQVSDDPRTVLEPLDPGPSAAALPVPLVTSPEIGRLAASVRLDRDSLDDTAELLDQALQAGLEQQAGPEQARPGTGSGPAWQVQWWRGCVALAGGRAAQARKLFDGLYTLLPGEAAPKLALALACEAAGDPKAAAERYGLVWSADRSFVSAAFGLARVRLGQGEVEAAASALDQVAVSSRYYQAAQIAVVLAAVRVPDRADLAERESAGPEPAEAPGAAEPGLPASVLAGAGARLERLDLDQERRDRVAAEVLEAALDRVRTSPADVGVPAGGSTPAGRSTPAPDRGTGSAGGTVVLGAPLTEEGLRRRLEQLYRELARLTGADADRRALVDQANAVRPRTWI